MPTESSYLFPAVEADVTNFLPPVPSRPALYLVIAWSSLDGRWTIPSRLRGQLPYPTVAAAEEAAASLPSAWAHQRVVRIPGDEKS